MNKLYEQRRFDDIIHVYNKMSSYNSAEKKHLFERAELLLDALIEKVSILSFIQF
jgi:hypothetical protein